jgi:excinuclease ABC subunit C
MATPEVLQKVQSLPDDPGVYLFRGSKGEVLYVGKAKHLRARVRCYFQTGGDGRPLARYLDSLTRDVEVVVTDTEKEALLLENTFIKRHKPRFNIRLKDDKTYLSLRVDPSEEFPRLHWVRRWRRDGALYFGPFGSTTALRETYRFIQKTFGLRACSDSVFRNRSRPCILHPIGRCSAPCVGIVGREAYAASVDEAVRFLRGGREATRATLARLRRAMQAASEALEFERAANLRDEIAAIEKSLEEQKVESGSATDRDVFGLHREGAIAEVAVLHFRDGKLVSSRADAFRSELPDAEILSSYVEQFYAAERYVPAEILLPTEIEDREILEEWLRERRGAAVAVLSPKRGGKDDLVRLATRNAEVALQANEAQSERTEALLASLRSKLALSAIPRRIHAFDVSNLHGDEAVGSRVAFDAGEPDRDRYRRFRIKATEAPDDPASMSEIVRRSLAHDRDAGDAPPDLVIVDGGLTQLRAGIAAAEAAGFPSLDVVGLAKGRSLRRRTGARPGGEDRVVLRDGREVRFDASSAELRLLQRIRDEAHRTAIRYHRLRRSASRLRSPLEEVEGLGPKRRRALLKRFGGLAGLRAASLDELIAQPDVPEPVARRVHALLHGDDQARG